ncbi:hypothetical protein [Phormidesmis priestleyi]|uniref:hypothetical protein n=1 Tax=Phormidesmis priestleyi TaxID=268141 RepID=UPI0015E7BE5D|nr:hypothetical protein [Phormidesmis priestleyi]
MGVLNVALSAFQFHCSDRASLSITPARSRVALKMLDVPAMHFFSSAIALA